MVLYRTCYELVCYWGGAIWSCIKHVTNKYGAGVALHDAV